MRLQTKLLAVLVPLGVASAGTVLVFSGESVRSILVEGEAQRTYVELEDTARRSVRGIGERSERELLPLIQEAVRRDGATYAMALDASGRVLAHSNVLEQGKVLTDAVSRRVVAREGPGFEIVETAAGPVLDVSVPVWAPDEDFLLANEKGGRELLGAIRVGRPLTEAASTRSRILTRISFIMLFAGLVAAGIFGATLRRLLLPVRALAAAADLIGRGQYGAFVEVRSADELGELSAHFNRMSADLGRTSVSKDFLDGVIRGIADGVFVTDPAGAIRMVNPAGLAMLGRPEAEVVGRPLSEFLETGAAETVLGAGGVKDLESVLRRADAREVPILVSTSALRGRDGSVQGAVSVAKDLTARKDAEAALRGAYSMLSATLEATADGILVVDQESRILRYNQKFVTMWKIPAEVMAARDDNRALGFVLDQLEDPEAFLGKVRELYGDTTATSFDVLEFRDGRVFERYSQPQVVNGVCVGRVWDFRDVSEHRRLQSMLAQSEKLSAVGQLAAGVAHEINNPLGVILGFAQAALRRLKPDHELALPVRSIEREAQRCSRLVKNLLTFSRQNHAHEEDLDVNESVAATLTLVETHAKVRGVAVVQELAAAGRVRGDRIQFQQVVLNLCNNAVDATAEGSGKVVVRTRDAKGEAGPAVVVEVEDNGAGIPEDVMDKIYNPFFTTKEVGKGTGLGLSLVHEIVERHRGTIAVQSRVGAGTTFTVTLPAVPR